MAKLTKRTVDAAPPKERDYIIWDEELPRFGLRVRTSGTKTYVVQYRAHGRIRFVTLGHHGPVTPEHARKLALGVLAEVAAGGDPAEDRKQGREALTLRQLAGRYLAEHAGPKKKPRSAEDDRRMLDSHILPTLGGRRVLEIRSGDVEKIHVALRDRPIMGNRVLSLLSALPLRGQATWPSSSPNAMPRSLCLSIRTLQNWRLCGRGPRFVKLGHAVRCEPAEIERFLAEARRASTSDPGAVHAQARGV